MEKILLCRKWGDELVCDRAASKRLAQLGEGKGGREGGHTHEYPGTLKTGLMETASSGKRYEVTS